MLFQKGLVFYFFQEDGEPKNKSILPNNGIKQVIRLIITFNKTKGHAI
jgi:hypothetical protein